MEANVRARRLAAVAGIVMQLGWFLGSFQLTSEIPWPAAIGISVGVAALAGGLVYVAVQGSTDRAFYATVILSSGLVWGLVWGLIGLVASETLGAPVFRLAGFVFGPAAGGAFGCFVALRPRARSIGVPEITLLGTLAGALVCLTFILDATLGDGSFENWQSVLVVFVLLGALGGIASYWVVSLAARRLLTPST